MKFNMAHNASVYKIFMFSVYRNKKTQRQLCYYTVQQTVHLLCIQLHPLRLTGSNKYHISAQTKFLLPKGILSYIRALQKTEPESVNCQGLAEIRLFSWDDSTH